MKGRRSGRGLKKKKFEGEKSFRRLKERRRGRRFDVRRIGRWLKG